MTSFDDIRSTTSDSVTVTAKDTSHNTGSAVNENHEGSDYLELIASSTNTNSNNNHDGGAALDAGASSSCANEAFSRDSSDVTESDCHSTQTEQIELDDSTLAKPLPVTSSSSMMNGQVPVVTVNDNTDPPTTVTNDTHEVTVMSESNGVHRRHGYYEAGSLFTDISSKVRYRNSYGSDQRLNGERVNSTDSTNSASKSTDILTRPYVTSTQHHSYDIAADGHDQSELHLPWLNHFLGNQFAVFLMKPAVRVLVILVYLLYVGVAVYGILNLQEGLKIENLVPDTSYVSRFLKIYNRDFVSEYGPAVQIVYDTPLDYTDAEVVDDYRYLLESFARTKYFYGKNEAVVSWLQDYELYLERTFRDINALDSTQFVDILRNEFLNFPGFDIYRNDIVFDTDNSNNQTVIKASRFFVQSKGSTDALEQREMMLLARDIARHSNYDVISFSVIFPFFDMYVVILPNTLQSLGLAVACMFVVSLIFIPSFTTVILVTLATVSIEVGVIGYMALWDVYLDAVSMINLIMCIGFSVDFAAHISYHYVVSKHSNPVQNAKDALGHLGVPILLAALSTILAVVTLSTSVSYVFRTFFKIVTMIMLFGFFHAMFLLPVVLSTVKSITRKPPTVYLEKQTQTDNRVVEQTKLMPVIRRGKLDYVFV